MNAPDPLGLVGALVTDSGVAWGQVATDRQHGDVAALLDTTPGAPRLHFLTRPRGGSKTTDGGAAVLAALIGQAPDRSVSHAYARDKDQAALLLDAIGGFVARTGLAGLVEVQSWQVTVRASGARLVVESADAASATATCPTSSSATSWRSGRPPAVPADCGRPWSPGCPSAPTPAWPC